MKVKTNSKNGNTLHRVYNMTAGRNHSGIYRLKNVYVDYLGGGGALESVPGYRKICSTGETIHSMFYVHTADGRRLLYLHSGSGLYRFDVQNRDGKESLRPILELANRKSYCIGSSAQSFISDGERLVGFDSSGDPLLISNDSAIVGCRVMHIFDGRLFLSGNPDMPGKIFYSTSLSSGEVTFSDEASIDLTLGSCEVREMIALGSSLWIFRGGLGDGNITRLNCSDGVYTEEHILSGVAVICMVSHLDSIIVLTEDGVCSLENALTGAPTVRLLTEIPLSLLPKNHRQEAKLGLWMGYLAIMSRGKILLLDRRETPCSVYPIEDIGGYSGDRVVYRYSSQAAEGYETSAHTDSIAEGEIFSLLDDDGIAIYYEQRDGKKLAVYPTEERRGGSLIPAKVYLCDGELMWFATEDGEIFIFNNDKRGVIPDTPNGQIDEEKYRELHGNRLNPYFYSFGDHAAEYLIELSAEDGDSPDLKKVTLPGGLIIGCKALIKNAALVTVKSDDRQIFSQPVRGGELDFSEMSFLHSTPSSEDSFSVRLSHRGPQWRSKQIIIRGCDFRVPIAISSVSHRFLVRTSK